MYIKERLFIMKERSLPTIPSTPRIMPSIPPADENVPYFNLGVCVLAPAPNNKRGRVEYSSASSISSAREPSVPDKKVLIDINPNK